MVRYLGLADVSIGISADNSDEPDEPGVFFFWNGIRRLHLYYRFDGDYLAHA